MNNNLPEKPPGKPFPKNSFMSHDRPKMSFSAGSPFPPANPNSSEPSLEDILSVNPKVGNAKLEHVPQTTFPHKDEPVKDDHHLDINISDHSHEPDHKDDHYLDIKIADHPKETNPKEKKYPDVPHIEVKPIYDYPEKLNLAEKTGDAVDVALSHLGRDYLENGEIRRKAWLRPIIPLAVGFGVGVLKPVSGLFENIGHAAVINSVLSPAISLLRRVTGENAFSQFARFANRRENSGLIGRIFNGGESRVLKSLFLREDRDMRQLLRLKDQGADLKDLVIGNKNRINNLIASGFMAELKAKMIAEYNVNISAKDNDKLSRMHEAYGMARELFLAKIPTRGQQEKFLLETLPSLLSGKERSLWLKQTAGLAGVGIIKTTALVTLGHIFTLSNIKDFAKGVGDVFSGIGTWTSDLVNNVFKPAIAAAGQTAGDIGRGIGTAFDGLQKAVGDGLSGLATWKDTTLGPGLNDTLGNIATWKDNDLRNGLSQMGQGLIDLKDKGLNAIGGIGNPLDALKNTGNPLGGIGTDPGRITDQIGHLPPDVLKFANCGIVPSHPADIAKLGAGVGPDKLLF